MLTLNQAGRSAPSLSTSMPRNHATSELLVGKGAIYTQALDGHLPVGHFCSSLVQGTPRGQSLTLATVLPLVARRTLRPALATHRVAGHTWPAGTVVSAAWSKEAWLALCREARQN